MLLNMLKLVIFATFLVTSVNADITPILEELRQRKDLEFLLIDLLNGLVRHHDVTCMTFICDPIYLNVFEGALFRRTYAVPYVMIVVEEYEDLLEPSNDTLVSLEEARRDGCNVNVILLANAIQTARLLIFGDRYRILDTRAKFIMLHDFRLFHSELHYIWKRIVNVIFLRYHRQIFGVLKSKAWFDLSTVPFPNPIRGIFIPKRVDIWNNGRFHYNRTLFAEKTRNLNGEVLNVVYLDHVPSVVVLKANDTSKIGGVEIEILNALAEKMNFKPKLYQPLDAEQNKWGQKGENDTFSGLLGEMVGGHADMALGNLQYTPYHLELMDLSNPYTSQCWTFLTPEALTDNSWKTLILPFKLYMWITVLLVLLITGAIFYGLANYYMKLEEYKKKNRVTRVKTKEKQDKDGPDINWRDGRQHLKRNSLDSGTTVSRRNNGSFCRATVTLDVLSSVTLKCRRWELRDLVTHLFIFSKPGLYLFGEIINSILYTYGMLLVVSLPKLPTGWSIRLLTGWYWLYCILLVVSYRASMTAILANPTPRVTIDTLKELVDSKVTCGGWGNETRKFFEDSLDDFGQRIGARFETIDDPHEAAKRVAQGIYAYYDNSNFLKYLSVKRKNSFLNMEETDNSTLGSTEITANTERNLHIMTDCVVNIPISIGFHKNSPLKPLADGYLRRIVEVGLVEKWLNDAMHTIRSLETSDEEIKALMNLKKLYGAFVALGIGYLLSTLCLFGEIIHWHFVVKRDPNFDKYALDIYYENKNKKQ